MHKPQTLIALLQLAHLAWSVSHEEPAYGHFVPVTNAEAQECAQWQRGTLDTYHDSITRQASSGGFTSQFRQDKTLFELLFSLPFDNHTTTGGFKRRPRRGGVYLDVASNHYKRISNTYFYDRCLNWHGVCVEPNPIYHDELRTKRSCELIPTCASNRTDEVELKLPTDGWVGALGGINGGRMQRYAKQIKGAKFVTKTMRCVRLGDELERLGIKKVDLFSLDVEGHEASVLRGIDFCKAHIAYVVCEANCAEVLSSWGYTSSIPHAMKGSGEVLWTRPKGKLEGCGFAEKVEVFVCTLYLILAITFAPRT